MAQVSDTVCFPGNDVGHCRSKCQPRGVCIAISSCIFSLFYMNQGKFEDVLVVVFIGGLWF